MNSEDIYERYQRQISLKELGISGQQKLLEAKVLVIGAGGLGCPALQYLAAAGVGSIGIADHDTVALHNLHRQPLYTVHDIGLGKAYAAAAVLQKLNPHIHLIVCEQYLNVQNALDIIDGFDIIIDGTDNFATRYLVNDACVLLGKPLVYGSISQYEGQVAVFNAVKPGGDIKEAVNYRDLFPDPPREGDILTCETAGVLGVLPGIIGSMMACEAIKIITGIGLPLAGRLLCYNALNNQVFEFQVAPAVQTRMLIPANAEAFKAMDYDETCTSAPASFEIGSDDFRQLLESGNVAVVDVREAGESPAVNEFQHTRISFRDLEAASGTIQEPLVVVFCQTGIRSRKAADLLSGIFGHSKKIYSLKGGIVSWKQQHQPQHR